MFRFHGLRKRWLRKCFPCSRESRSGEAEICNEIRDAQLVLKTEKRLKNLIRDSFTSLPIYVPLVSFSWADLLVHSSVLKRSGGTGLPCLAPDFSEIASSVSPFRMMLTVGFSFIAMLCWNLFLIVLVFRIFIMKAYWIFVKGFCYFHSDNREWT